MDPVSSASFIGIPREIRDIIYDSVFDFSFVTVGCKCSDETEARDLFYKNIFFDARSCPKALMAEEVEYLYDNLEYIDDTDAAIPWCEAMSLRLTQESLFRIVYMNITSQGGEDIAYYKYCFDILTVLPKLQNLVITYDPDPCSKSNGDDPTDLEKNLASCGVMELAGHINLIVWCMRCVLDLSFGKWSRYEKIWVLEKGETEWKMILTEDLDDAKWEGKSRREKRIEYEPVWAALDCRSTSSRAEILSYLEARKEADEPKYSTPYEHRIRKYKNCSEWTREMAKHAVECWATLDWQLLSKLRSQAHNMI